jgi:hypothetical protein
MVHKELLGLPLTLAQQDQLVLQVRKVFLGLQLTLVQQVRLDPLAK